MVLFRDWVFPSVLLKRRILATKIVMGTETKIKQKLLMKAETRIDASTAKMAKGHQHTTRRDKTCNTFACRTKESSTGELQT